eukprot:1632488-Pyramimonas_sp.AAC.1
MHVRGSSSCLLGCLGEADAISHYLICPVLRRLLFFPSSLIHLLGLAVPNEYNAANCAVSRASALSLCFLAFHNYHKAKASSAFGQPLRAELL